MVLYCIITYLMMLGFIIEGENPKDYKFVMLLYALSGPIIIPIMLGVFIAETADYMKKEKKEVSKGIWRNR